MVYEGDPYWEFSSWSSDPYTGMGWDPYVVTISNENINIEEGLINNPYNVIEIEKTGNGPFDPLLERIPNFHISFDLPGVETRFVKYQQNYKIINGKTGEVIEKGVKTLDVKMQHRLVSLDGTELVRMNNHLWRYPLREINSPFPPLYP